MRKHFFLIYIVIQIISLTLFCISNVVALNTQSETDRKPNSDNIMLDRLALSKSIFQKELHKGYN